jgi:hypothetical protein
MLDPVQETRRSNIIRLYRAMPGAPRPPRQDGVEMWGDVDGNEHWEFCAAVVDMMATIGQAYAR